MSREIDYEGELSLIYNATNAIIQTIFDSLDGDLGDLRRKGRVQGLMMALERINNEIGRMGNVIE